VSEEKPAVFVVDDDTFVREALRNLFRSVGWKVEMFASAQEFLSSKRSDTPSCLVLDVRLPGLSGLDLQRSLAEAIPIVFITGHGDIPMSVRAMKAGAVEFLTKPFRDQELLDAAQEAINRDRTARASRAEKAEIRERYESMTAREQEVMKLVIRGLLNKQVAAELGTAEATVKLHRGRVMKKMHADSLADLIRMGEKLGVSTHIDDSAGLSRYTKV
jgi:FixJ family two-component response regulator